MKMKILAYSLLLLCLLSCEKDFDIEVKENAPMLVVEGYINNELVQYNYVVLSRSQNYYAPDFQSIAVGGAEVSVTEGAMQPDRSYNWDARSRTILKETENKNIPPNFRKGVYFDPRALTDPSHALMGRPGKYYLLEISVDGEKYSAVTTVLPVIKIDSLTSGFRFIDKEDENKEKARITIHYKDPDTIGNRQIFYRRVPENRSNFGWGGLLMGRSSIGTDDLSNGQYIRLTQPYGYPIGDTVQYYLASVDRTVYNFWDSFNKARNDEGPFSTPASLLNTINGNNVTGCFSGFSISTKTTVAR